LSDKLKTTVIIRRPAKIQMDGRGRSVWSQPVDSAELELLSSTALKKILKSNDNSARIAIEVAAESRDEGILARDVATGRIEIVDDAN